ncbi:hypothetical protein D3C75_810190 [compost metagenome]
MQQSFICLFVLVQLGVCHSLFHFPQLPLGLNEVGKHIQHFRPDAPVTLQTAVLCQITDTNILVFEDFAAVIRHFPGNNLQQRGFSRPVDTNQADSLSVLHLHIYIRQHASGAVALADVRGLKQNGHGPSSLRISC